MTMELQTVLLTTVNAPYQNYIDAGTLAAALMKGDVLIGQVGSFFTETNVDAQKAFAEEYGIPDGLLTQAADTFSNWSGQTVALIA